MNSNSGYEKIVPPPATSSHEAQKEWRKKAILVVIFSTILLVCVICVGIQLTHNEETGHNRVRSSDLVCNLCNSAIHYDVGTVSASVRKVCNSTSHYDLCVSSLSSFPGSLEANMSELARIAAEVSLDEAIRVNDFVAELKKLAEDQSRDVLEDCTELLGDTVDQLNSSISVLGEEDWKQSMDNLSTWLSAALTNPSTCIDDFGDSGLLMDESMKQKIENLREMVSNDLAIVNFVSASENSMDNVP